MDGESWAILLPSYRKSKPAFFDSDCHGTGQIFAGTCQRGKNIMKTLFFAACRKVLARDCDGKKSQDCVRLRSVFGGSQCYGFSYRDMAARFFMSPLFMIGLLQTPWFVKVKRDSVTRFFASGFFYESVSPKPDYTISAVSNFFENSRRYSQLKVCHRCQRREKIFNQKFFFDFFWTPLGSRIIIYNFFFSFILSCLVSSLIIVPIVCHQCRLHR